MGVGSGTLGTVNGGDELRRIVRWHRARARADSRCVRSLARRARSAPPGVSFVRTLEAAAAAGDPLAVVAEFKRKSPSAGWYADSLVVGDVVAAYQQGGAAALSVLTEYQNFGGRPYDLGVAKRTTGLPVLRKDFTVCEADVYDARLMGADAVLLIAAVLSNGELWHFAGVARNLGMDVLVEAHDEIELERAVAVGSGLVGVNQRDLNTFTVDPHTAERLAPLLPAGVLAIAESGVTGWEDVHRLATAGYRAALVGGHLLRSDDPARAMQKLRGRV